MHIHEEVLRTANRLADHNGIFDVNDVVKALGHLRENTVRTDIVSRCCINAPRHHARKWDYFRRVGRGKYQIEPQYRRSKEQERLADAAPETRAQNAPKLLRSTIHALVQRDGEFYVVECLELPVVTQGSSLDEALSNLHEALSLHLEDENLASLGLVPQPRVEVIYDMGFACPA